MLFDAATVGGSGRKYQIGSTGTGNNPGTGCFELYDATGGATRLVCNASGNVGINTTSPNTTLDVNGILTTRSDIYTTPGTTTLYSNTFCFRWNDPTSGAAGTPQVVINSNVRNAGSPQTLAMGVDGAWPNATAYLDTQKGGVAATVPLAFRMNGTEYMRIATNGYVGIGTTAPARTLDVWNSGTTTGIQYRASTYITGAVNKSSSYEFAGTDSVGTMKQTGLITCGSFNQDWTSGGYISFSIISSPYGASGNITEYMRLSNGYLGIGTTSPAYLLDVSGTIRATGDVIAYSDSRVKTDLKLIDNALNKVSNIHGYTFLRTDTENPVRQAGVIAQEVREILPEVVYKDDKGMYNVAYGNMVALLIEAIKEERSERLKVEERLARLEQLLLKE
jgi:hypothetical protein